MASFRVLGQFVQYFLNDGSVNAGGSVTFYETDLTTLKNTYSDMGLTVPNANPLPLDADGRLSADCWGSGVYGAVLKDASGTTIQTLNNVQAGTDPGLAIPSLVTSDFLTNDGSNLLWQAVRQVPDPTGSAGKIIGTDGTLVFWQAVSTLGIPSFTPDGSGTGFKLGNFRIQTGSATLPASGSPTTSIGVTFATAFSGTPYWVGVTNYSGTGATVSGRMVILAATGVSSTGFTIGGDLNNAPTGSPPPITNATSVRWFAFGPA